MTHLASLTRLSLALALASSLTAGCAMGVDGEFVGDDSIDSTASEASVRGRFDLWRGDDGQYYFHLEAGNYETVLTSEGYQSRTGALGGILSVLDNGGLESRYTVKEGADGQSYLSLRARNGKIIATGGEGYATRSSAMRAVKSSVGAVASYLEYWNDAAGARFDVFESARGGFHFNLHARNGAIVLSSQEYGSEAAALNGAFSVVDNGVDAANYELRSAASGGYYIVLFAANNQIIGTSEIYANRANAERAIDSMVALLPEIELL